eukprot:CAMPEP_0194409276 /NCGR_PEP_ID=MMETSP0176-20130528/7127_1 /TAXON_ID=216777 /ORGANISM="Proboscia alata, Strain PI-D3" /LENGTH=189 /DNA_ID=CAMNT_0039209781 /DNA_START=25 /DNA_END=591 /DNA_ORIENTATION=-
MEPPIPQNLPCHAHPWNNLRGGAVMVWISTFDHVNIGTRGSKSEASSLPVIPSPLQYSTCRPISDSGDPWGGSGLGWYSGVCCTGILGGLLVSRRRGVTDRFVVNAATDTPLTLTLRQFSSDVIQAQPLESSLVSHRHLYSVHCYVTAEILDVLSVPHPSGVPKHDPHTDASPRIKLQPGIGSLIRLGP